METLNGTCGVCLQDVPAGERFHSQNSNLFFHQHRQHLLTEAAEMRVQNVKRHLHSVETEFVLLGDLQDTQMHEWILVPGKPNKTDLARRIYPFHPDFNQAPPSGSSRRT